ncbi:MAG: methyltransferase domain-containing protein [Burkholderiales bacterium]
MKLSSWNLPSLALCIASVFITPALAQNADESFSPTVGQAGKDVVWVPTPPALVETMLDMAKVTPRDFVMDLGSGDGRNVIAAAKRGARALGVEFNPKMVELSKQAAAKEGVADKAQFVQGDMFEADISQATVLALFLLSDNLRRLTPKFLELKPGTRIVLNHYGIDGWEPDETQRTSGECLAWCTALLYIVPAKVAGTWRLPQGELTLEQNFQMVSGTFAVDGANAQIEKGRLRGDELSFTVGRTQYVGRVNGDVMTGTAQGGTSGAWKATRAAPFEPMVGQEGKDVIWVPTPLALTEKMLDMAKVTPNDFVIDLGSGDGRNVIAAAKRGARGLGVEYNEKMVELSKQIAAKEGVADKAQFVQGDMYEADISQATVMALFLLPENLRRLTPKFLALKPGARIVANGFGIDGWEAEETGRSTGECGSWCTAFLYIVPAQVAGTWRLPNGELTFEQKFQMLSGTLKTGNGASKISSARLNGDQITFTAGDTKYSGRVVGDVMEGRAVGMTSGAWKATKVK